MERIKSNHIISDLDEMSGYVYFENGIIQEISERDLPVTREYDCTDLYVCAGFIDIHTHGGGGNRFEGSEDEIVNGCNFHLSHGVTSIYPTVSAAYISDMKRSVENIGRAKYNSQLKNNLIGAHLEGPYLSLEQTGAQGSEFITPPIFDDYSALIGIFYCCISLVCRYKNIPIFINKCFTVDHRFAVSNHDSFDTYIC
jgi:N-acetylglucosamine-6-phosphate deacetylase